MQIDLFSVVLGLGLGVLATVMAFLPVFSKQREAFYEMIENVMDDIDDLEDKAKAYIDALTDERMHAEALQLELFEAVNREESAPSQPSA